MCSNETRQSSRIVPIAAWNEKVRLDIEVNGLGSSWQPVNDVFISAIVAWEIVLKHAKGKLTLPLEPALYMSARLRDFEFHSLPITQDHALASLPDNHAEPFDRMMIAQLQVEGMTFVTRDAHALAYQAKTLAG